MVKIEKKQSKQSAKIYNMSDDEIATYIGYKGYAIYKENISVEEQQMLRKELNVKPFVPKNSLIKPQPFPVYRESKSKLYVPRFYGMEVYGEPDDMVIKDGKKIITVMELIHKYSICSKHCINSLQIWRQ